MYEYQPRVPANVCHLHPSARGIDTVGKDTVGKEIRPVKRRMKWVLLSAMLLVGLPGHLHAQEWARKMFKATEHDFGSVAKSSKQEFAFEFENIYEEDVHIASVRTSCGCTTPTISKSDLKTWEKSSIVTVFNTRTFLGQRSATITVTIDRPFFAEVQLQVRGYIRSDVVFSPGSVDFGSIDLGTSDTKRVQVTYAGRSDWHIEDVQSSNSHFEVELKEANRGPGRVTYEMLVQLKPDAPEGPIQDRLLIVTDDPRMAKIPLFVEGRVVPALTVSPSTLYLGDVKSSGEATGRLIVKGKQPFKIKSIECENSGFQFKTPETSNKVHVIPVTFKADANSEKVTTTIEIDTDLNGGTKIQCHASVRVSDPNETAGKFSITDR